MLTLQETFTVPDADHAWTAVPCVPGARVRADSAHAVDEIAVTSDAVANVGGKAAGTGEGVIGVPHRPRQVVLRKRRDGGARPHRSPGTRCGSRRSVSTRERSELPRRQGRRSRSLFETQPRETL